MDRVTFEAEESISNGGCVIETQLGEIDARAAEQTGIPAGLPLIAAAADKACEVLGSGCLEPEIGCLSYGTTATINTVHHRYIEPTRYLPPYPAAAPGRYTMEVQIFRGYWMVSWFKQQFGHREQRIAEGRYDLDAELVMEVLVARLSKLR